MKTPQSSATEPVPWVAASRTGSKEVPTAEMRQLVTARLRDAMTTTTRATTVCPLTQRNKAVMKDNRARPPRCNRLSSWKVPASLVLRKKAPKEVPNSKCQHLAQNTHTENSNRCDRRALEAEADKVGKAGNRKRRILPPPVPLPPKRSSSSYSKISHKTRSLRVAGPLQQGRTQTILSVTHNQLPSIT